MRRKFRDSIVIPDLDGPGQIVDASERDHEAQSRVRALLSGKEVDPNSNEYKGLFYSKDAFYDVHLLHLDKLNPGALQAIERLRELYTDFYIVTSRPDFMADPTVTWLSEHGIVLSPDEIRFKLYRLEEDVREQFVSTPAYKEIIAYEASWVYQSVLFIDNEERNRRAVAALRRPNITIKESLTDYIFDDSPIIL